MCATMAIRSSAALSLPVQPIVHLRRGQDAVLNSAALLTGFAELCEQSGAASDLAYFLTKPGVLKRTPLLLLFVREPGIDDESLTTHNLLGALLLYEYQFSGFKTGLYTSNDRSGRSTLIAPASLRASVARSAAQFLLKHKALLVLFSFRHDGTEQTSGEQPLPLPGPRSLWAVREREIPEFLPLAATYDQTLARIGQRTRSNLRYYRRRAERELGCSFVPRLKITESELLAFNRTCMYAVADRLAGWRLSTLQALHEPILMGMSDREGQLLSVIGGRRVGTSSEVLWQMNRKGLPHLSLSLVMRGHFIEHEIGRGAERFYIEGGTPHPIRESFTKAAVTDLAVLRRSPMAAFLRKLARHTLEDENALASMLFDETLEWQQGRPTKV